MASALRDPDDFDKGIVRVTAVPAACDIDVEHNLASITLNQKTVTMNAISTYTNPALHVTPQHTLRLENVRIPTPQPDQVLIHVKATGVCGSDLHLWKKGGIGSLKVSCDSILGHEAAGVIVGVGSAVTNLELGDRVAIEPGVPCHQCFLCRTGKYNLCENVAFAGVCPHGGSIQRFMVHDARYCHKIPADMSFARGALLEPLSVVLHAISLCEGSLAIGKPALICGAGPIGLIALAAAKASGSWPLVITDVDEFRLSFAKKLVPGVHTYHVGSNSDPLISAEEIRHIYGCGTRDVENGVPAPYEARAPTTVLECTGVESSVITAAHSCRRNGTVMVIGVGAKIMNNLPFMHLSFAEIKLRFTNRYVDTWPAGIEALANNQVLTLDDLVTHTFPLERAVEAMEVSADRSQDSIKVQIVDDTLVDPGKLNSSEGWHMVRPSL